MDTKWATTELAWTAHPETGVSSLSSVFMKSKTGSVIEKQMVEEKGGLCGQHKHCFRFII